MERRRWTEDEDRMVRSLFGKMTLAEVARRVGRPLPATRLRAFKTLGLRKGPSRGARSLWSKRDDRRLRQWHGRRSSADIAFRLGRTTGAVQRRATILGIKQGPPPLGAEKVFKSEQLLRRLVTHAIAVPSKRRWKPVHALVWEAAHGPIPAGHFVCFRPGMKVLRSAEITVDRLQLVTPAELPFLHHPELPPELIEVIRLSNALRREVQRVIKELKE